MVVKTLGSVFIDVIVVKVRDWRAINRAFYVVEILDTTPRLAAFAVSISRIGVCGL
jgi:hypothetical protein